MLRSFSHEPTSPMRSPYKAIRSRPINQSTLLNLFLPADFPSEAAPISLVGFQFFNGWRIKSQQPVIFHRHSSGKMDFHC